MSHSLNENFPTSLHKSILQNIFVHITDAQTSMPDHWVASQKIRKSFYLWTDDGVKITIRHHIKKNLLFLIFGFDARFLLRKGQNT